jgi:hypothetical protein
MNELEIKLLIVGAVIIVIVAIFLITDSLRRAKLDKDLELAKNLDCTEDEFTTLKEQKFAAKYISRKGTFAINFWFFIQLLFSITLLAGSAFVTVFLVKQELIDWAAYTGVMALIGLLLPFVVLGAIMHRHRIIHQVNQLLHDYDQTLLKRKKAPEIAEPTIKTAEKPVTQPAPAAITEPVTETHAVNIDANIPEDSMLRRHYLTQLQTEKEGRELKKQLTSSTVATAAVTAKTEELGNIPEDSMLRRHYLTHLRMLKEAEVKEQTSTEQPAPAIVQPSIKVSAKQENKMKIPEDSTLRRHFITQLITEIEGSLPPRPTDSTLRRHYDYMLETMKEQRLSSLSH